MTSQVRWVLQVSKPGRNDWVNRDDLVYSGWFHSTGNDEASPTVLNAYEAAAMAMGWLDVRLLQETRTHTVVTLREELRAEQEDPRPCKGQNSNICVAEGCYGESCLKEERRGG